MVIKESLLFRCLRWLQKLVVKTTFIPAKPLEELNIDPNKPIAYVLKSDSKSDLNAIHYAIEKLKLPSPLTPLELQSQLAPRVVCLEYSHELKHGKTANQRYLEDFSKLLELHQLDHDLDVQLIPVSSFWGRTPGHDGDNMSSSLIERQKPSRLRKLLMILFLGRRNFIQLSKAVSIRYMADNHGTDERIAQKLARVAKVHFRRQHRVLNGPPLPKREVLCAELMKSDAIKKAILDEAKSKKISQEKATERAKQYLDEIAANYSDSLVRTADHILTWLWNKLYRGIEITGVERIRQLSHDGHEIVYLPCHRSHMDYLLLSYLLYYQGMIPPHIAAGINLNFWPAGPIFRRGGAFFIRRSFAGNKLYTGVFKAYLDQLFNKGYSVEYFTEGGRSRTGRLLQPKTGMLAMTVQSMMRGVDRPVTLVPVYLGYDHVMEVATYHKELKGAKKEKESAWQVLGALKKLKNFGRCHVNFGEPITLHQFYNKEVPNWRADIADDPEQKPNWLTPSVNILATQVMRGINDAAAVSAGPLTAMTLLASDNNALERPTLEKQLDIYLQLLRKVTYSETSTVPNVNGKTLLAQTLELDKLTLTRDDLGEMVSLSESEAISMTYYRNNILHMMIMPAIVASIILHESNLSKEEIIKHSMQFYPMLQAELFLNHPQPEQYLGELIDALIELELAVAGDSIQPNEQLITELQLLAGIASETLQRYGILFNLLALNPEIDRPTLEKTCQQLAKRLGSINGINAPEFFDKKLYSTLSVKLKEVGFFEDDAGKIIDAQQTINHLLPSSMLHTIQAGLKQ
ncbi:glycerol-3-phosphate 1-O-acyltransferase PlsB [Paraferrimonas sp. SM1919]|uniref:glycerol-3-phosphate 1-O-acyltransferase PlsB n=1 Tax=Paraferrimonas sp. SM1919 TaxID=2662263 RepID=UPI0013D2E046|nr:glycerol-3-phosphate 1-O-acyltransferase PlsB [Paraferrimonas sp. SM1919]